MGGFGNFTAFCAGVDKLMIFHVLPLAHHYVDFSQVLGLRA
jgi:hypothetical protein